jgi:phosphopantothenoylcysteine decarboxylase / phosphopantothenate---cysteine ligase
MKLLLAVSGGIAAYKACEIVSLAIRAGHELRVMMTPNGTRFVTPLTFEALTGHPVLTDAFSGATPGGIDHIAWAKWADHVIVAPATANLIAKMAAGLADDAVSTVLLAIPRGKLVTVAPAMNTEMWFNPVVERNLRTLGELGRFRIVAPTAKRLACGDVGPGGLAEPKDILAAVESARAASPTESS